MTTAAAVVAETAAVEDVEADALDEVAVAVHVVEVVYVIEVVALAAAAAADSPCHRTSFIYCMFFKDATQLRNFLLVMRESGSQNGLLTRSTNAIWRRRNSCRITKHPIIQFSYVRFK